MKSLYKKAAFHNFDYQSRFQKKDGKRIARKLCRVRGKEFWKKNLLID